MEDDEELYALRQRRRRSFLYGSFLLCVLGTALVGTALGTQHWLDADVSNANDTESSGHFHSGLFQGQSILRGKLSPTTYDYYTACLEQYCMFSCGSTNEEREQQLRLVLDGKLDEVSDCMPSDAAAAAARTPPLDASHSPVGSEADGTSSRGHREASSANSSQGFQCAVLSLMDRMATALNIRGNSSTEGVASGCLESKLEDSESSGGHLTKRAVREAQTNEARVQSPLLLLEDVSPYLVTTLNSGDNNSTDTDGLLDRGLWGGTIGCLCAGLLFALLGAVFAVINTATTPVEAITGITGLYIWNTLAAVFELVAVILWSVQFSTRFNSNVLVVDSRDGWTTEGNEKLGYSFWLVVVSVIVHLANCFLIGFGTYEPKVKAKIQEPDKATNDILLY